MILLTKDKPKPLENIEICKFLFEFQFARKFGLYGGVARSELDAAASRTAHQLTYDLKNREQNCI